VLITTSFLTILLSGNLTNRWAIIFPMIPLLVLQLIRRVVGSKNKYYISWILGSLSILLILIAGALSILFPAVEFPPLESSKYNVGVVHLFLPVNNLQYSTTIEEEAHGFVCPIEQDYLTVRILYPTLEEGGRIPYLRPETSHAYCEETVRYGAPPPLRKYSWMVHMWRLTQLQAKEHAQPLDVEENNKMPIIVYSPGLGGNAEMYSYQTRSLAANGYVVLVVDHMDGSASVVLRKDGTMLRRNESVRQVRTPGLCCFQL
jgi:platelet-activating factor acetylhydrolase